MLRPRTNARGGCEWRGWLAGNPPGPCSASYELIDRPVGTAPSRCAISRCPDQLVGRDVEDFEPSDGLETASMAEMTASTTPGPHDRFRRRSGRPSRNVAIIAPASKEPASRHASVAPLGSSIEAVLSHWLSLPLREDSGPRPDAGLGIVLGDSRVEKIDTCGQSPGHRMTPRHGRSRHSLITTQPCALGYINHLADAVDLFLAQILKFLKASPFALSRIFSARGCPIPKI